MAGTAPTDFDFIKTVDAGPVHCSVWLAGCPPRGQNLAEFGPRFRVEVGISVNRFGVRVGEESIELLHVRLVLRSVRHRWISPDIDDSYLVVEV